MVSKRPVPEADAEYLAQLRRKIADRRVPYTGSLELTRLCSVRCLHCYCGDQDAVRRSRAKELTTDQWLDVISQIADAGCLECLLTGGEPMLRSDFTTIYEKAKLSGMVVSIFTNATLVDDRVLDLFLDLPPFLVEVSLYGSTAETHDSITQVPGSFARALRGVELLLDRGVRVTLKTVLMTLNKGEYQEMERLAAGLGTGWRSDAALFPCLPNADSGGVPNRCSGGPGFGSHSLMDLRVPAAEAAELECAEPARVEALRATYHKFEDVAPGDALYTCGAGLTGFHVDPYGSVQPCTMTPGYRESIPELGFAEAWEKIGRIRKVRAPQAFACNRCRMRSVCSGCPAMFDLENGDAAVKSDYICSLARERCARIGVPVDQRESENG